MRQKRSHEGTKDEITVSLTSDGGKNCVLLVTGTITSEQDSTFSVIDVDQLSKSPPNIRLDALVCMVESGLKVILKYRDQPYVLPLEGRGKVDLSWVVGIVGREIEIVCKGTGSFFIVLDLSKMGV